MTIFCLGLGIGIQRNQLALMATDPDTNHVITAGYDEFDQVLPKLKRVCCKGEYAGSPTREMSNVLEC